MGHEQTPSHGEKKEKGIVRKGIRRGADIYHKNIYRRYSAAMGKVLDTANLPFTDIAVPAFLNNFFINYEPKGVSLAQYGLDAALGLSSALFYLNLGRTKLTDKLGLEKKEYVVEDEVQYVINQLNSRAESPELLFEEIVPLSYEAVTDFLEVHDGYRTESTRKAKKGHLLNPRRLGNLGMTSPATTEVLVSYDFPEVPAHELAHPKGLVKEDQAQIASVLSHIESGNPSLEYIGYFIWLQTLITSMRIDVRPEEHTVRGLLQEYGLNQRTFSEIDYLIDTPYKVSPLHHIQMRLTGQKNYKTDYVKNPIAYLADYRGKFLE